MIQLSKEEIDNILSSNEEQFQTIIDELFLCEDIKEAKSKMTTSTKAMNDKEKASFYLLLMEELEDKIQTLEGIQNHIIKITKED